MVDWPMKSGSVASESQTSSFIREFSERTGL